MENKFSEYLSTPEAARYLRVSRFWLEAARCRGNGPKYVKLKKSVRYCRGDLDEFMRAHQRTKTLGKRPACLSIGGAARNAPIQGGSDDKLA